jgi:hypothetical protein
VAGGGAGGEGGGEVAEALIRGVAGGSVAARAMCLQQLSSLDAPDFESVAAAKGGVGPKKSSLVFKIAIVLVSPLQRTGPGTLEPGTLEPGTLNVASRKYETRPFVPLRTGGAHVLKSVPLSCGGVVAR